MTLRSTTALQPTAVTPTHPTATSATLEQAVRRRIDTLSYLPTTVAVAMKFVELGKSPDAEPGDYARIIAADASLSSKLLALANSSWFGVRNKVTKTNVAVNLLGLGTVRTLAISYCLTGLHNDLRLSPEESRMFWAASLCKAVAARLFVTRQEPALAEEAFAAALFQDFAVAVMYATARETMLAIVDDVSLCHAERLDKERTLFHLDHAEIGRIIAQKLELPELFVDNVAFHHNLASLREFAEHPALADAMHVAALFPHSLNAWNSRDAEELKQFVGQYPAGALDVPAYMEEVQKEFNQLYAYFENGKPPETRLTEMLEIATREAADGTGRLISTVHELLQEAAGAGKELHSLLKSNDELADQAARDPLTGALNRQGLSQRGGELLAKAGRYGVALGIAYLDLDAFKTLNDTLGHHYGDAALKKLVTLAQGLLRPNDLIGRVGGDEFVLILYDLAEDQGRQLMQTLVETVGKDPLTRGKKPIHLSLSAGLLWVPLKTPAQALPRLVEAADHLMYQAKRAGGNRLQCASLKPRTNGA